MHMGYTSKYPGVLRREMGHGTTWTASGATACHRAWDTSALEPRGTQRSGSV
ncbi:hypothetical protein BDN71DRAFT_1448907, partial [Pleurotus eryngii]